MLTSFSLFLQALNTGPNRFTPPSEIGWFGRKRWVVFEGTQWDMPLWLDALDDWLTPKRSHRRVLPSASPEQQHPLFHAHLSPRPPSPIRFSPRARDIFHLNISSSSWLVRHRVYDSAEVTTHNCVSRGQVPSSSMSSRPRSPCFESFNTAVTVRSISRTLADPSARSMTLRGCWCRLPTLLLVGHSGCAYDLPCTSNPSFPKDIFFPLDC